MVNEFCLVSGRRFNLHHNPYSAKTHTPGPIPRGMGYIRVDCNWFAEAPRQKPSTTVSGIM